MSICVVQYYNRIERPHLMWRTRNNFNKCTKNCTYINIHATETRPPYWEKVFRVRDIAESMRSTCEFVLYLDNDAVLNIEATSILTLFAQNIHMMYSKDPPPWKSPFNAGVWVIRNSLTGRDIMRKWTTLYPQHDWVKHSDKWDCIHRYECKQWAGPMYEQGSFVRQIIPAYKHAIRQVSLNIFSGMGMVPEMAGKRQLCPAKSLICHIFNKSISEVQYINTSLAAEEHA